jgi:hypothetical protein
MKSISYASAAGTFDGRRVGLSGDIGVIKVDGFMIGHESSSDSLDW